MTRIVAEKETSSLKLVWHSPVWETASLVPLPHLKWLELGTGMTLIPSFIPIALQDGLPLFLSGRDPGKEPPTALGFCETRRALIRKGTHYCESPQQRLIASGVGPQTWHLCPPAGVTNSSLTAILLTIFSTEMQKRDFLTQWLALYFLFILFCILCFIASLFLIVRQTVCGQCLSSFKFKQWQHQPHHNDFVLVSLCVRVYMPGI